MTASVPLCPVCGAALNGQPVVTVESVLHVAALNRPYARVRWEGRELVNTPRLPSDVPFLSRMCDSHADALAFVLSCARPQITETL